MSIFIYYRKNDPKKEPYGRVEAIDLEDAILVASHTKHMEADDFLKVFEVEEWKKNLRT
jgi:hypothetical protein